MTEHVQSWERAKTENEDKNKTGKPFSGEEQIMVRAKVKHS